ncbi:hypothetical protein [Nocardia alni]|uniref:hypothetical protein n=1 Tax=Nocardia alni TaxID=2815723 RepID=UPI001C22E35F|nr:hypothetical protein [Nocardia alni]
MEDSGRQISEAVERLALTLGESGAVPIAELVRALERAAERLRTRTSPSDEVPVDLVTQAEASRTVGVSRQAVNQWVRKGILQTYSSGDGRGAVRVSLSEVAIAANRHATPTVFSPVRRRELEQFLDLIDEASTRQFARELVVALEADEPSSDRYADESRVLREFVVAAMDTGSRQREFTADGVRLLSDLRPQFAIDRSSPFGRLCDSLGLLVYCSDGSAGFDSPVTALLGLLGASTVGSQYQGGDATVGSSIAAAARRVWDTDWPTRLFDAAFYTGELHRSPLTRYTASLTYLDNNRFLRQAQSTGVSLAYSRGPGPLLPQRFHGAPIQYDILTGDYRGTPVWGFTPEAAAAVGRPADISSAVNPFRIFNYEYGLLDSSIHGIRRYCFSVPDARKELIDTVRPMSMTQRQVYLDSATETLARTLASPQIELVAIDRPEDFDWWKDHIIRSSEREILLGLRDERARKIAHALLVQTKTLPDVIEAADSDSSLRDRLRIYVKNLEFDVIEARYQDDLRRGVARVISPGGRTLDYDASHAMASEELRSFLR